MKNPANVGGADLLGGDLLPHIKSLSPRPLFDDLSGYRALHLIQSLGVRPELASMLAALAFGGGR